MAYSQLTLYNEALIEMKATPLSDISEFNEARRVLDAVYDNVLAEMLEAGYWKFAIRSVKIEKDPDITPAFGEVCAFNFPTDWVKTYIVSGSERFDPPLESYKEEAHLLFAESDPIYLRYVSNSNVGYGMDFTRWTQRFHRAVALELAWRACPKAAGSSESLREEIEKNKVIALSRALAFEAHREPTRRPPEGRWNRARRNYGSSQGPYYRY